MTHNQQVERNGTCGCLCHQDRILPKNCMCGWLKIFPQDARRSPKPYKVNLSSRVVAFTSAGKTLPMHVGVHHTHQPTVLRGK